MKVIILEGTDEEIEEFFRLRYAPKPPTTEEKKERKRAAARRYNQQRTQRQKSNASSTDEERYELAEQTYAAKMEQYNAGKLSEDEFMEAWDAFNKATDNQQEEAQ